MLAREIMIPEPYVAAAGATSAEVALLMVAKDISVVPVVGNPKERRYLGTISDRDIVTGCVAVGHDPKTCKVQMHARQDTVVLGFIPHPEFIQGIVIPRKYFTLAEANRTLPLVKRIVADLISLHLEWRDLVAQYELVAAQARPEGGESTEQLALRGRIEATARQINVRAVAEREATFASDRAERYFEAGYRTTREALAPVAIRT